MCQHLLGSLERLSKKWQSPIYAFYNPVPDIQYHDGRRCHVFKCSAVSCKYQCRRFLDKGDANSTGNLRKHVKSCWGADILRAAEDTGDVNVAREKVVSSIIETGSITASFERKGKGKVTYSNRQHTRTETRSEGANISHIWCLSPPTGWRSSSGFVRICAHSTFC